MKHVLHYDINCAGPRFAADIILKRLGRVGSYLLGARKIYRIVGNQHLLELMNYAEMRDPYDTYCLGHYLVDNQHLNTAEGDIVMVLVSSRN